MMDPENIQPETENKALTSIRETYTLFNTINQSDDSQEDQFIIRHFLRTLAEVALSIASRKNGHD